MYLTGDMIMSIRAVERKLPTGTEEFETLVSDLKNEYGSELPTVDDDSLRFVIATTIMHLGPLDAYKSLEFFYKTIVGGASKQVAHYVFRDIKLKQEAAQKAATEEQQNTPTTNVVSIGS